MWQALLGGLIQIVGTLAGKTLISLGIGYVAFQGLDVSIAFAKTQFFGSVQALQPMTIQILGLLQVDTAVNMLFSALVMRLTFKGMVGGVMKAAKLL